jgi:hypothetical protein
MYGHKGPVGKSPGDYNWDDATLDIHSQFGEGKLGEYWSPYVQAVMLTMIQHQLTRIADILEARLQPE